jgi:GINS complex subunit 2
MGEVHLMSGTYGPFHPQVPVQVPLWFAVYLTKRNQCLMKHPEWLTRQNLTQLLETERSLGGEAFGVLPSEYFVEIAVLFLEHGKEMIAENERVRQLVEQIIDCRKTKVMDGLSTLTGPTLLVKLNNLTKSELNVLRPFMLKSMKIFDDLDPQQKQ